VKKRPGWKWSWRRMQWVPLAPPKPTSTTGTLDAIFRKYYPGYFEKYVDKGGQSQ